MLSILLFSKRRLNFLPSQAMLPSRAGLERLLSFSQLATGNRPTWSHVRNARHNIPPFSSILYFRWFSTRLYHFLQDRISTSLKMNSMPQFVVIASALRASMRILGNYNAPRSVALVLSLCNRPILQPYNSTEVDVRCMKRNYRAGCCSPIRISQYLGARFQRSGPGAARAAAGRGVYRPEWRLAMILTTSMSTYHLRYSVVWYENRRTERISLWIGSML